MCVYLGVEVCQNAPDLCDRLLFRTPGSHSAQFAAVCVSRIGTHAVSAHTAACFD